MNAELTEPFLKDSVDSARAWRHSVDVQNRLSATLNNFSIFSVFLATTFP